MQKIFIFGSSGKIGQLLVDHLSDTYDLVLGDIAPVHSGTLQVDLMRPETYQNAFTGIDCLIHLAGVSDEIPDWQKTLETNVVGSALLFEAARKAGIKRIIYASSVQAVGFYPRTYHLTPDASPRPCSFYGVSKVAGEALARLYADKYGLSCICLRIFSFEKLPLNPRHLTTWISPADIVHLFKAAIDAKNVNFAIVNGVSKNQKSNADNPDSIIPYSPVDNAEDYKGHIKGSEGKIASLFYGGEYCEEGFSADIEKILQE